MLSLRGRITPVWDEDPFVARLELVQSQTVAPGTFRLQRTNNSNEPRECQLSSSISHLQAGDVVWLDPRRGDLHVMYRLNANTNSLLLTERCNAKCIMCSQPPRPEDDSYLIESCIQAIELMSPEPPELGLTGGEPTLLGDGFLRILAACKTHLPSTAIHVLSNGRMFNYLSLARAVAGVGLADLMFGIPLYSDLAGLHDYVMQARGAFTQTVRGIMNLKRCGVRVEIRIVLHSQTVDRLPSFARFVARNFPNVDHVALMGLEPMGYGKTNFNALWADPHEYRTELREAVEILADTGLTVSIYNHQLCLLDQAVWPFARKSISDWKNDYVGVCNTCAAKNVCGGFFSSSLGRHSSSIRALSAAEVHAEFSELTTLPGAGELQVDCRVPAAAPAPSE